MPINEYYIIDRYMFIEENPDAVNNGGVTEENLVVAENLEFAPDALGNQNSAPEEVEFRWVDECVRDEDIAPAAPAVNEEEFSRYDDVAGKMNEEKADEYGFIPDESLAASADPYASGFDEEHPKPTYQQLRNAGFSKFEANQILYGPHDSYSEKELFECLYSDHPKEAYDAMMRRKTDEMLERIDRTLANI